MAAEPTSEGAGGGGGASAICATRTARSSNAPGFNYSSLARPKLPSWLYSPRIPILILVIYSFSYIGRAVLVLDVHTPLTRAEQVCGGIPA